MDGPHYLRGLLATDDGVADDALIWGVGVGVFLLGLGAILSLLYCIVGYCVFHRPATYCCRASVVYGALVVYLFAAERSDEAYENLDSMDYNFGWYAKYTVGSLLLCCCYWCSCFYAGNYANEQQLAMPSHAVQEFRDEDKIPHSHRSWI